jgi:hypothetical protein
MLATAIAIFKETLDAYRNHTLVNLASRVNQQMLFPLSWSCSLSALACIFLTYFFRYKSEVTNVLKKS